MASWYERGSTIFAPSASRTDALRPVPPMSIASVVGRFTPDPPCASFTFPSCHPGRVRTSTKFPSGPPSHPSCSRARDRVGQLPPRPVVAGGLPPCGARTWCKDRRHGSRRSPLASTSWVPTDDGRLGHLHAAASRCGATGLAAVS